MRENLVDSPYGKQEEGRQARSLEGRELKDNRKVGPGLIKRINNSRSPPQSLTRRDRF